MKDNWSTYTNGNWELNSNPPWAGISGSGGSPEVTIVHNSGLVDFTSQGLGRGVTRTITPFNQAKTHIGWGYVSFVQPGSAFGGGHITVEIDSNGSINTGNAVMLQSDTSGNFTLQLLVGGVKKAQTTPAITLGAAYLIAVDHNFTTGTTNTYLNGVLQSSWAFPSAATQIMAVSGVGPSLATSGNLTMTLGTVGLNGSAV